MNITPQHVAAVYEMLRQFKPFDRWKLPEAETVGFHVKAIRDHGLYWYDNGHNITVSSLLVDSPHSLLDVTAHEVIHMRQQLRGEKLNHNSEFRRLSQQVCREFMWDAKRFIG